jgi:alkaline phosphatase D
MRRLIAPILVLSTLVCAVPAAQAGFAYGVAAGDVGAHRAILWTRAPNVGRLRIVVNDITPGHFGAVLNKRVRAKSGDDRTVNVVVSRLKAGHRYAYFFVQGLDASVIGTFRTAPAAGTNATVKFAVSGDADAQPAPGTKRPYFNRFQVYDAMRAEHNGFNVNLGDTIYSDSEVPGAGAPALTKAAKWAKYRQNLGMPALRRLRAQTGLVSEWDDHEFINDFSIPEDGLALYRAGRDAFLDYSPATYTPSTGLYRTIRWGANVQAFVLDMRSFRSAEASAGGVCNNPTTHQPDLAPTVPQLVRGLSGLPQLADPVSQACLNAIADPARTMLGAAQLQRFEHDISTSTARFKVILTEDPIQQFYALPYDRWEGYQAERLKLLHFLVDHVKNVVFIATDTHANFINDVRFQTLENSTRVDSGITEAVTGPVAAMTFTHEINSAFGANDAAAKIVAQLLKPAKLGGVIDGIQMRCAQTNAYSYAEVHASASQLQVTLKDASGHPIVDQVTRQPCAPVVLHYQP